MEGVNGEEDQAGVTQKQVKDAQDNEEDLDPEEYNKKTNEFFEGIIKKMKNEVAEYGNKIEKAMVTNITNDLSIVKALVVEFCTQNYMKTHVKGKVKCIEKEVDEVIKQNKWEKKKKEEEEEEEERKSVKTSEWLYYIGQKTAKIKNLVSQFGSLPDEEDQYEEKKEEEESSASSSSVIGGKREKQKTVSNSTECHKMCIEESLLISPMMAASLKKSFDHLPSNELKLCLLTLSAFPEDFIIKKRPLIYWWMAEGFVVGEEVGEQNFTQLIQHGLIQPWYESGNTTTTTTDQPHNNNVVHVQGCRVHPWIRRMLVSIAMDAQLFEFFGIPQEHPHPHPPGNNPHPRSRRVCLYDDGEGVDDITTWKTRTRKYDRFRERFKWIKGNAVHWERIKTALHDVKGKEESPEIIMPIKDRHKEVSDRQRKLLITYTRFLAPLNILVAEVVAHGKIMKPAAVPRSDHHDALLDALNHRLSNVKTQIDDAMKNNDAQNILKKLQDEQMELVKDIEGLEKLAKDQLSYLESVLDTAVYERSHICNKLQKNELLFRHNDLNKPFPFPMKKKKDKGIWTTTTSTTTSSNGTSNANKNEQDKKSDEEAVAAAAERLLAIINVTQKYLDMDHEAFGKMKRLRTLHLGRWRDSLPVPHIEVEDARILEALFHVAKHLKYLSLRGISRITELPSNISNCCNLQILDLKACYNLEKLPAQIAFLYKLTHLDVSECYLLQNNNLWSLVQPLQFLQTLKGLKVDQSTQTSLKALATADSLRKLSIILTERDFNIDLLTGLSKLCILTITWRITPEPQQKPGASTENPRQEQPEKSDDGGGGSTENPPQQQTDIEEALPNHLKKLDLRCYPDKDWPNWAKKHSSLETLYITGGDLEEFPRADLNLPKLQLLRFKYLTKLKLGQDFNTPHLKSTIFPSLITFINHSIKSKK
ncbi:PREDICTED: uncharacterized protein LOC109155566 isoform X2 [Ipomoea nil]|uniref:uncharacterized protein LOC109155566 isoform X2 n=1 Tax=Ipomoea nil TaxID=35883 RepID=UPI000900B6A2|nr:PREDICTED: uncharacterized protein LOC109155566 isoform X2 [Ipomoea nil]XP_019158710.1 PREDICTED: uncharacterized protein LOC109155566 isoform X2 [Ipomoea nil]